MWEQCLLQLSYLFNHFHHIVQNTQQSGAPIKVCPYRCWLTTPPGSTYPTLFEQWCRIFYVPQEQISESAVKRDLRFFSLYPRRLESHCKGSTFSSVILRAWVLVWPGFELPTSHSADRCSPNWANQAAVIIIIIINKCSIIKNLK